MPHLPTIVFQRRDGSLQCHGLEGHSQAPLAGAVGRGRAGTRLCHCQPLLLQQQRPVLFLLVQPTLPVVLFISNIARVKLFLVAPKGGVCCQLSSAQTLSDLCHSAMAESLQQLNTNIMFPQVQITAFRSCNFILVINIQR